MAWVSTPERVGEIVRVVQPRDHGGYVVVAWPGEVTDDGTQKLHHVGAGIGLIVVGRRA